MLSSGIFPDRLKCAKIKPLFKGGCKKDPSNYRPVFLEEIISFRLIQCIFDHNIKVSEQFSFRHQSSTTKASCLLLNDILEALNKQKFVEGIFYNLKRACISVNHKVLLSKLQFYGIDGKFHNLIASYLSDRWGVLLANAGLRYEAD
jgi:hypothetical protein